MKKQLLFLGFLLLIKPIYAQAPKADFDIAVTYNCGWAFVELVNNSINADSCLWCNAGYTNCNLNNNPRIPIGNLSIDGDFKFFLMVKSNGMSDTLSKSLNFEQTRANFTYSIQDTMHFSPLPVDFINLSYSHTGDTLSYFWDFGDGDTSILMDPTHVYNMPRTYHPTLAATTRSGCVLFSGADIIVKDTAQRNEFDFVTGGCFENEISPCGYDKHYVIENDTLKIYGFYSGNCCTQKTATARNLGDTVFIRTFQTGPECTCGCMYCFSINVPSIYQESVIVSFDGNITVAKLYTSLNSTLDDHSLAIYPNPVDHEFTLSCNRITSKSSIVILDLFGRVVYNVPEPISETMVIQCNHMKPGIYILKVNMDEYTFITKKILINSPN